MKALIPAKAKLISKSDKFIWPYNLLEINFHIDEIQTDVTLQLAKENIDDSMDIFNGELVGLCEEMLKESQVSITRDNKVTDLTSRQLALIVSNLAFTALEKGSEWNKSPFKLELKSPNTFINEFKKKNKVDLAEIAKLEKALKTKKEPSNTEIMHEIKKIQVVWIPVVQTNNDQIISPVMTWEAITISNVKTNKIKQEWDTKFTSRADFKFSV